MTVAGLDRNAASVPQIANTAAVAAELAVESAGRPAFRGGCRTKSGLPRVDGSGGWLPCLIGDRFRRTCAPGLGSARGGGDLVAVELGEVVGEHR
jgi:hypothetical protein